jgi:AhpD family alkylhydroperoxidase
MKDGALKKKEKELVALGIAAAQRCEPCIILHVQKSLELAIPRRKSSKPRVRR